MENNLSPGELPAYVKWSNRASEINYHQRYSVPKYFEHPRSSQERYQSACAAAYQQRGNLCVVNGLLVDDVHNYDNQTEPVSQSPGLLLPTRTVSTDGRKQSDFSHQRLPPTQHPGRIAWAGFPGGQTTLCRTGDKAWVLNRSEVKQPSNKEAWQGGCIELKYSDEVEAWSQADGSTRSHVDSRTTSFQSTPVNTYSQAAILQAKPQASNRSVRVTSAGTAYDHARLPKIVAVHSLTQEDQALLQGVGNELRVVHSSISSGQGEVYAKVLSPRASNEAFQLSTENPQVYKEAPQVAMENLQLFKKSPQVSKENPQVSKETLQKSTETPQVSEEAPQVAMENLQLFKKAPQVSKENPQVSKETLQKSTETPQVSEEAPQVAMENLQLFKKAPQVSKENPQVSKETPQVSKETHRVPQNAPQVSKETPRVTQKAPQVSKENPRVPMKAPQVSKENPRVPKKAPQVSKETPRVPKKAPQVSTKNPQLSMKNPQASNEASSVSMENPDKSSADPKVALHLAIEKPRSLSVKKHHEVNENSAMNLLHLSRKSPHVSKVAHRVTTMDPHKTTEDPPVPRDDVQLSGEPHRIITRDPHISRQAPRLTREGVKLSLKAMEMSSSKRAVACGGNFATPVTRNKEADAEICRQESRIIASDSLKTDGRSEDRRKSVKSSVPANLSTDICSTVAMEKADKTGGPSCVIIDCFSLVTMEGAEPGVAMDTDETRLNLVELPPSRDTAKYCSPDPSESIKVMDADTSKKTFAAPNSGGALHKDNWTVTKSSKSAGVTFIDLVDNGSSKATTAELGRNNPKQNARGKEKPRRRNSAFESTAERNIRVHSMEITGGKMATLSPAQPPRWNPLSKQRLLKAFKKRAEQLEVIVKKEPSVDKKKRLVKVMEVLGQRIKTLQEDLGETEFTSFSDDIPVRDKNSCSHKTDGKQFKEGFRINEREESGRLIATSCKPVVNTCTMRVDRQIGCREKAVGKTPNPVGETPNPVDANGSKDSEKESAAHRNRKRFTKSEKTVDALSLKDCKSKTPVGTGTKQVKQCEKPLGTSEKRDCIGNTPVDGSAKQTNKCRQFVEDYAKQHRKAIDGDKQVQKESENMNVVPNTRKLSNKGKKHISSCRKLEENKSSTSTDGKLNGSAIDKTQPTGHRIEKLIPDEKGHDAEVSIASPTSQYTVKDSHSNYKAKKNSSPKNLFDNLLRRLNAMETSTASALRSDLSCNTTQQLDSEISGQRTDGRIHDTLANSQCNAGLPKLPSNGVINANSMKLHCSGNDDAHFQLTVGSTDKAKEWNTGTNAGMKNGNVKNENCIASGDTDKAKQEVSLSNDIPCTQTPPLNDNVNAIVPSSAVTQTRETLLVLSGASNTSVKQLNSDRNVKERKTTVPRKSATKASPFTFEHLARKIREYHANPLCMDLINEDAKEVGTSRRRTGNETPVESLCVGGAITNRKRKLESQSDECGNSGKKSRKSAPKKLLKFIKAEKKEGSGTGLMMIPRERLLPNPCGEFPTGTEFCEKTNVCKMEIETENAADQPSISGREVRQNSVVKSVVGPTRRLCSHTTSSATRDSHAKRLSNGTSSSTHVENLISHSVNHGSRTTPKNGHTDFEELQNSNVKHSNSHLEDVVKRGIPRDDGCFLRDTNLLDTRMRDSSSAEENQEQQISEASFLADFPVVKTPVSAMALSPSHLLYSPDLFSRSADDLDRSLQLRDVKINNLHRKREKLLEDLHKISTGAARNV